MITFKSETLTAPNGATIETGTVTLQGRDFSATGAIVDTANGRIDAYASVGAPGVYSLTTWEGVAIAPLRMVRRWKQWGFGGVRTEIWAWSATIDGTVYSGRNGGPGMHVRMRAGRTEAA